MQVGSRTPSPSAGTGGQSKAEGQKQAETIGVNPHLWPFLGVSPAEEVPGAGAESWSPYLKLRVKQHCRSRLSQKHVRSYGLKREVQRVTEVKGTETVMAAGIWSQESENQ